MSGNQVLYFFQNRPDTTAFVCEVLIHIPENIQVPPE